MAAPAWTPPEDEAVPLPPRYKTERVVLQVELPVREATFIQRWIQKQSLGLQASHAHFQFLNGLIGGIEKRRVLVASAIVVAFAVGAGTDWVIEAVIARFTDAGGDIAAAASSAPRVIVVFSNETNMTDLLNTTLGTEAT